MRPVLTAEIAVFPDRMDIQCHTPADATYPQVKEALERIVAELSRIIAEGPEKCPHAQR